jgi:quercetin dioxygenase-like cupin family protein
MTNDTAFTSTALVQALEQADTTELLGGSIAIRLRGDDTGGRIGMTEQVIPGGFPGPALHVHPTFEETFYVISGALAFRVGDDAVEAGPGAVAHIPRGVPHTFANLSDDPARTLVIVTPAGFEAYFEAVAEMILEHGGMPSAEDLAALGIAHGSIPAGPSPLGRCARQAGSRAGSVSHAAGSAT